MRRAARILLRWYSILVVLAVWQIVAMAGIASPRIVPDLRIIADAFYTDVVNGVLVRHAGISLMRALSGYVAAVVVGIALGGAMSRSRIIEDLLEPIFFLGYPVPKIALFPVFTFVFGIGTPSKIAFIFLECLYPITIATYFGVRQVDRALIWSARSMGASPWTVFRRVLLPAAGPAIFAGLRIAMPISIIVVVITEMIGDTTGLGFFITYSGASFEYDKVYAGIVAVGILGFSLDRIFALVHRRVIHWQRDPAGAF